ncbi:protein obstructor-E-like isoform X2 [Artemia franciscana]|uniref:protein obstructor-E-like isoform X2 n=1 Tax=Artemia franciscana TaxID=6661 RepID=UPI0032DB1887
MVLFLLLQFSLWYLCYAVQIEKCEPSKIPYKIADDEFCDKFTLCEAGKPTEMSCPDGLMFDFRRGKCDMPHVVNCDSRTKTQNPRSTLNCPRENGMFEVEGTCNQFYHCTDGRHTLITCPEGVIFEPKVGACIHPDLSNRKNCSAAEILSFECPNRQHRFRRLKFGDHDRLPHPETCRMFIMCLMTGEPRLGGCSMGLVFNPKTGRCDLPKNVKGCENFYGVEEEEDSSEAGLPGFGSFVDDGVAASKDRAAELISEGSRPEGRQRKVIKKMKIKA